jgi:archaemetzincin
MIYNLTPLFTPGSFETDSAGYSPEKRQWDANKMLLHLADLKKDGGYSLVVGITEADLYVPGSNFIFGLADPSKGAAIVSVHRLRELADSRRLAERVYKEVAHELGHLLGLKHCEKPTCIMSFAKTIEEVDVRLPVLCSECSAQVNPA